VRRIAAACAAIVIAVAGGPVTGAGAAGVPYDDTSVAGVITLCDRAGHPLDHGSTRDRPLAWSAVSSAPAPTPYDADGRTATLLAYQPRKGLSPREWSGDLLTASARYSNAAHPMAQATNDDASLQDFLDAYPTSWDGFVQLRIYLGAPEQPAFRQRYAALDVKVSGDRWVMARGGTSGCGSGQATSVADILVPSTTAPPSAAPGAPAGAKAAAPAATVVDAAAPEVQSASSRSTELGRGGSGSSGRVAAGIGLLAVAAAGAVWLQRRRASTLQS
jgi:hypothetical protein